MVLSVARRNKGHDPFPEELTVPVQRQYSKSLKTRDSGATGIKIWHRGFGL